MRNACAGGLLRLEGNSTRDRGSRVCTANIRWRGLGGLEVSHALLDPLRQAQRRALSESTNDAAVSSGECQEQHPLPVPNLDVTSQQSLFCGFGSGLEKLELTKRKQHNRLSRNTQKNFNRNASKRRYDTFF